MIEARRQFLVAIGFALLSAALAVAIAELAILGVTGEDGPTDMGASPVVALAWLAVLWLGRGQVGWSIAAVATALAAAASAGLLLVALPSAFSQFVTAGIAGAVTVLLHRFIQVYAQRVRASVMLPAIAALAGLVTATDTPRLFRESSAPVWTLVGLAFGLVVLAGVVVADGLGAERGRLRHVGFVLLAVASLFGGLGLLL